MRSDRGQGTVEYLTVVLLVAVVRRDRQVWRTVVPLAAIGAVIAAYHTQLQAFPAQRTFCSTTTPCTTRYVWEFGFVSLPFMALTAFCFILAMVLIARIPVAAPSEGAGIGEAVDMTSIEQSTARPDAHPAGAR